MCFLCCLYYKRWSPGWRRKEKNKVHLGVTEYFFAECDSCYFNWISECVCVSSRYCRLYSWCVAALSGLTQSGCAYGLICNEHLGQALLLYVTQNILTVQKKPTHLKLVCHLVCSEILQRNPDKDRGRRWVMVVGDGVNAADFCFFLSDTPIFRTVGRSSQRGDRKQAWVWYLGFQQEAELLIPLCNTLSTSTQVFFFSFHFHKHARAAQQTLFFHWTKAIKKTVPVARKASVWERISS